MNITPTALPVTPASTLAAQTVLLAAEAVLATLLGRAPTRVLRVSLQGGLEYALEADPAALQANRGLLEDVVMVRLAGRAAQRLLGLPAPVTETPGTETPATEIAEWLRRGLTQPEEQAVAEIYVQVLEARATALLRTHWAEVQVVAAGLGEAGELGGEAVRWRMDCAQGIRGRLLN